MEELEFLLAFYADPRGISAMAKVQGLMPQFTALGQKHGERVMRGLIEGDASVFN